MNWLKKHTPEIHIFCLLIVCYAYFFPRWADWNQNSRLDMVMAIVDQGTFAIDDYYQNTGDYAVFGEHYYCDKAPGLSLLGVPPYWVFKHLVSPEQIEALANRLGRNHAMSGTLIEGGTGLLPQKLYFVLALTFVTFWTVAVPSALLGSLLYVWAGNVTANQRYRIALSLTYGLLTSAFAYSNMYFGHQTVALLLFGSFVIMSRIAKNVLRDRWAVLAGTLMGYAVITEYPSALVVSIIVLFTLFGASGKRRALYLLLGGLPWILVLMAYNDSVFGDPFSIGYRYSALYTWQHARGIISVSLPRLTALWGITFGSYRGLFYITPVLLLSVPGFTLWYRGKLHRMEFHIALCSVIAFFLFNAGSVMWEGGWSVGPRYILPIVPFLSLGLLFFLEAYGAHVWARCTFFILCIWSFVAVWAETIGGQHFPDWRQNPLVSYSIPNLLAGNIARNAGMLLGLPGWLSLGPLLALLLLGFWLLRSTRASGCEPEGC